MIGLICIMTLAQFFLSPGVHSHLLGKAIRYKGGGVIVYKSGGVIVYKK